MFRQMRPGNSKFSAKDKIGHPIELQLVRGGDIIVHLPVDGLTADCRGKVGAVMAG